MKSIIPDNISILAFDLDGTLYDEYDFVKQAFYPVSRILALATASDENVVYVNLCRSWLLYGSSANIFQMVFEEESKTRMSKELLDKCIMEYRNAEFDVSLSERTTDFLNMVDNYPAYIISDGNSELQRKKIRILGLDKWFHEENIIVSGDYGKQYYKPAPYLGDLIKKKAVTDKILYFGDRDIDRMFAENAGFVFQQVKNMICI